jgi:iron(II)-dependent oxidoreductase
MPPSTAPALDRERLLERFTRIRARTRAMFDLLDDGAYYARPIPLRNPIVFYEGHLPAFSVNTLLRRGLGRPGVDAHLERIFERGIDPESEATAVARGNPAWPSREVVLAYAAEADRLIADALTSADLDRDDRPLLRRAQAVWTILEHEEMHQETLAYMWHELPVSSKRKPALYTTVPPGAVPPRAAGLVEPGAQVRIPAGVATLGTDETVEPFAWDNELPVHRVEVDAFAVDVHNVTNADYLRFVDAGGYRDPRWWREEDWAWVQQDGVTHPHFWIDPETGRHRRSREAATAWQWRAMFEHVPLPLDWPVYVTWAEAAAYARWRGLRLMTEPEFHRAAGERRYPWGDDIHGRAPANFDFRRWDPEPVGVSPAAASPFGVHDLTGNGWEWTSTPFGPFDGFAPLASYPEYSADFFDGQHVVLKGASPFTARSLVRRGFRNWFRPRYPYIYASFRCVASL